MIIEGRCEIASVIPRRQSDDRDARIFGEGAALFWLWVWPHLFAS